MGAGAEGSKQSRRRSERKNKESRYFLYITIHKIFKFLASVDHEFKTNNTQTDRWNRCSDRWMSQNQYVPSTSSKLGE